MGEYFWKREGGWTASITGSGGGGDDKGGGGGKGKGGGGGGPSEDAESLRSRAEATLVGVISEGEIEGFEDGADPLKRIFLDGVPIKAANGSINFSISKFFTGSGSTAAGKGGLIPEIQASIPGLIRGNTGGEVRSLVVDYRVGTQNQDPMPGFDDIRVEQGVNIQLRNANGAVTKITNSDLLSKVRIRVGVGALFKVSKDNGDVKGDSVQFSIKIRPQGGTDFINEVKTIQGKSRGPVDFEYEYNLQGTGPWQITLERLTTDPDTTSVSNDTFWRAIVGIYSRSFRYPNTALVGIKIGAENFNSVPQISADILGAKIKIPSNYNPWTRTYTGIWDGTFVTSWSNNPAWVFYDLLTNKRYGAGEFIDESQVDCYALYSIAQYCDQLVPDGKGGMEPRFTFNAYITDQGEAYNVLNSLVSAFRGTLYFLEDTVVAVQDTPKQVTRIFSPANVIQVTDDSGLVTEPPFTYEGTARKARKTVALVTWNDPDDMYKAKVEYVEDRAGIERYGYRPIDIRAIGTTSQGQAQRIGRWTLLSNQLETETVTFKVAPEGLFLLPGEIIGIADPAKGGKRFGGRILGATDTSLTLDTPFELLQGSTYSVSVNCAGSVVTRAVTNGAGATDTLTLNTALPSIPVVGSPWIIQEDNAGIRRYRVISVAEENGAITVLGALYDENKFTLTDTSTILGVTRSSMAGLQVVPSVSSGSIVLEVPS